MLLVGAVYFAVGVVPAELAKSSVANPLLWRRLAWVVSAVAFAAHIGYEQFHERASPRTTAMRVSLAAAIGACGLAALANIRWWIATSSYRRSMVVSLVAWPLLVLIPAFVAALVVATLLTRWYRRG